MKSTTFKNLLAATSCAALLAGVAVSDQAAASSKSDRYKGASKSLSSSVTPADQIEEPSSTTTVSAKATLLGGLLPTQKDTGNQLFAAGRTEGVTAGKTDMLAQLKGKLATEADAQGLGSLIKFYNDRKGVDVDAIQQANTALQKKNGELQTENKALKSTPIDPTQYVPMKDHQQAQLDLQNAQKKAQEDLETEQRKTQSVLQTLQDDYVKKDKAVAKKDYDALDGKNKTLLQQCENLTADNQDMGATLNALLGMVRDVCVANSLPFDAKKPVESLQPIAAMLGVKPAADPADLAGTAGDTSDKTGDAPKSDDASGTTDGAAPGLSSLSTDPVSSTDPTIDDLN